MTSTAEDVFPINAFAVYARGRLTIIDVSLTGSTCEPFGTLASVSSDGVVTDSAILTGTRETIVYVDLTSGSGESYGTGAFEGTYEIVADATV